MRPRRVRVNKTEPVEAVEEVDHLSNVMAARFVAAFSNAVQIDLSQGETVTVPRFGACNGSKRQARVERNSSTGPINNTAASSCPRTVPGTFDVAFNSNGNASYATADTKKGK